MRRIKVLICTLAVFFSASLFAEDFDWSKCWCNYGAGIEKGDFLLSIDAGLPWDYVDSFNSGGWAIPYVLADFEVACVVGQLPFTFGGYAGFGYGKKYYRNRYDREIYLTHSYFTAGASANYHMRMPPKELDLYAGLKSGMIVDFSDRYKSGHNLSLDFGYTMGASWYFTENFGLNVELGYPLNRAGVVFKF